MVVRNHPVLYRSIFSARGQAKLDTDTGQLQ